MKAGVLFSGGKDSVYAAYLAKKNNIDLSCLITLQSENKESYMFHTPSITKVVKQAEMMDIPLLIYETKGEKEKELYDLQQAIRQAIHMYDVNAIITGAIESVYQTSRVQKICDEEHIDCFNPLWQKNQFELLHELIERKFEVILTGVFCYPLDHTWIGRMINQEFLQDVKYLHEKYAINVSGEGGEFETFVLHCPLYKRALRVINKKITGKRNAWSMEIDVE